MGYRSDVVIAISEEAREQIKLDNVITQKFPAHINRWCDDKYRFEYRVWVPTLDDGPRTGTSSDFTPETRVGFLWRFIGIKWYSSYDDIRDVHNWLNSLDPVDWRYVRVGEEPEDIEFDGDFDADIYPEVNISAPSDENLGNTL